MTRGLCRVIGLGNPDRGDDGVGRLVARLLRGKLPANVQIEERDGGANDLIELLRGADRVWLIDAAVSGCAAGTIHVVDGTTADALPTRPAVSSHGLGVAEAIALVRTLYGLPRICRLYAIEGVTFAAGAAMTPYVLAAAESLAERLAADLSSD